MVWGGGERDHRNAMVRAETVLKIQILEGSRVSASQNSLNRRNPYGNTVRRKRKLVGDPISESWKWTKSGFSALKNLEGKKEVRQWKLKLAFRLQEQEEKCSSHSPGLRL